MAGNWTEALVARIVRRADTGESYTAIGNDYGVSRKVIASVVWRARNPDVVATRRLSQGPRLSSYAQLKPARFPDRPDSSTPSFANNDEHVSAVLREGGYHFYRRRAA